MKKIGFIGAYDKTDLIIYIAKILTVLKKKVLVIDTTILQKARYIVPVINPTKEYITEYEGIDIAVGFSNLDDIKKYLAIPNNQDLDYDYIMIDVDNIKEFEKFDLKSAEKKYFVTSFDNYSLKKGLEVLSELKEVYKVKKVLFSSQILKEEDDYLNFLSLGYKIIWDEERIYFPIENGDLEVIHENQRVAKIKFKKLSIQYKDGLTNIAEEIVETREKPMVRRTIKSIEKGVW